MDEQPEWYTKKDVVEKQLARMREERDALKKQELDSREQQKLIEEEASQRETDILQSASAAEAAQVAETSALRERMAQVKDQAEDLMLDADEQELAYAEECRHLRLERLTAEKGLREEAKKLKDLAKQIEEVEVEQLEALKKQDVELQKRRQVLRQRRQQLLEETEAKALEMKSELMKELEAVHEELKKAKVEIHRGVQEEVLLRQQVLKSVDDDIHQIDLAVNQGLQEAKTRARDLQERSQQMIQEVQLRDFALEVELRQRVSTAVTVLDMAKTVKDSVATQHSAHEHRRRHTAKAFGDVFPRSTHFDLVGLQRAAKPRLGP